MNIENLLKELPNETINQINEIDTPITELTFDELIKEVKWSIEKMTMDIGDGIEDDWELPKQIKQCKKFLRKYNKSC